MITAGAAYGDLNFFLAFNSQIDLIFILENILANVDNWKLSPINTTLTNKEVGVGGFFPYGVSGVMAGAAKCFFGFVGFDSIAAAGEEAKNPKRNIPLSIVLTLIVVLVAYVGVSIVLTLMIPFYLQV